MSSQKGNDKRKRAQKYQNTHAFKNDLHDKSKKMQVIKNLETWGLCASCKGVIDWKIKYKKYKPLTQAKTCTRCSQKTVKRAYYTVCQPCSEAHEVCGKCGQKKELVSKVGLTPEEEMSQESQLEQELKFLSERQRRSFFRNQVSGNLCAAAKASPDCEDDIADTGSDEDIDDDTTAGRVPKCQNESICLEHNEVKCKEHVKWPDLEKDVDYYQSSKDVTSVASDSIADETEAVKPEKCLEKDVDSLKL